MRSNDDMKYIRPKVLILTILCVAFLWTAIQPAAAASGTDPAGASVFDMDISCGLDGYSKYGAYIPVTLTVTNHGADFSGTVQLILDSESLSDHRIAYTQNLTAAANETKTLRFVLSDVDTSPSFDIILIDDAGNIRAEQRIHTGIQYTDDVYIGILSDDFDSLSYLDGMPFYVNSYSGYISTRIFALDEQSFFNDAEMLSCLDAIIINDFDSSVLSDAQYEALKTWVHLGGTLMIGTGANASKTMSLFSDHFLEVSCGQESQASSDFDLNGYTSIVRSSPMIYEEELPEAVGEDNEATDDGEATDDNETAEDGEAADDSKAADDGETADDSKAADDGADAYGSPEDENIEGEAETAVVITDGEETASATISGDYEEVSFISEVLSDVGAVRLQTVSLDFNDGTAYPQFLSQELLRGSGRVVVLSFDLADPAFLSWDYPMQAVQNIFTTLTDVSLQGQMNATYTKNYYVADMLTNYIEGQLPKIGLFIGIIVVYIILVSPAAYLILKKKDRRQWLWIIVPALACMFTVVIFLLGRSSIQNGPYLNYSTVIHSDGIDGREQTYFSVTSPQNKGFDFTVSNEYSVHPALNYYSSYSINPDPAKVSSSYGMNLILEDDQTRIDICNINAFGSRYFSAMRKSSGLGKVETDISYVDGHYEGTVANHTGYALEDAFLILDQCILYIGHLDDGESYTISEASPVMMSAASEIPDRLFSEAPAKQRLLSGYLYNLVNARYSSFTLMPYYAFGAFVPDYTVSLAKNCGLRASGNTLYWDDIDVDYVTGESYSLPNLFYNSTLVSGDLNGTEACFYSDELVLNCHLPVRTDEALEMTMAYPGGEQMLYYFYNWDTREYDEVFTDGNMTLNAAALEPYVQDERIYVKLEKVYKETYSSAALPVICITGREN